MPTLPGFDPIAYLVKRRFLLFGIPPMAVRNSGKQTSSHNQEEAEAYKATLESKSKAEIEQLVAEERRAEIEEKKRRLEAEERGRFFHQPHARADFDHYCRCSYWTLDEAVALSFGKNPEIVNWKTVAPLVAMSAFAHQYGRLRDLAMRAVSSQQLFERMYPTTFLAWARQTGISVDANLTARALASGIPLKGWRDLYEDLAATYKADQTERARQQVELGRAEQRIATLEQALADATKRQEQAIATKTLGTRERENLQLIAFLGAVKGYGYDPQLKTEAARNMEADTDKLGMRFTDDRIRHHLKEGFERLPPDWRTRLGLKPSSGKT